MAWLIRWPGDPVVRIMHPASWLSYLHQPAFIGVHNGMLYYEQRLAEPMDREPFVKQTYNVYTSFAAPRRKWSIVAYYTVSTLEKLGTVDNIPGIGDTQVPDGYFRSARVNRVNLRDKRNQSTASFSKPRLANTLLDGSQRSNIQHSTTQIHRLTTSEQGIICSTP
ncbi:hypothetical protein BJ165DRAFT_619067 [Panaeolus papilionaceus]|nr:hypothetical protein BJ165DRAFT_619067 [Panaeolus papilionaceus]